LSIDYQKEVWQLHVAFHECVVDAAIVEDREEFRKIIDRAHELFDTLVMWMKRCRRESTSWKAL